MSDRTYATLKWLALIIIPTLSVGYFLLSEPLGLPSALLVVGSMAVISLILGVVTMFVEGSRRSENEPDGGLLFRQGFDPETTMPHMGVVFRKDPNELILKKTVTLRVTEPPAI